MTDIKPELRTPQEDWSGTEKAKLATKGLTLVIKDINSPANLAHLFRDTSFEDLPDVAEALAKSYGIYTDFNRATTGPAIRRRQKSLIGGLLVKCVLRRPPEQRLPVRWKALAAA